MCKDIGIQPSIMTDLKSGRKKGLSAATADKIASYFKVPVSFLLRSQPFTYWEDIKKDKKGFLLSSNFSHSVLSWLYEINIDAADDVPDKKLIDFISKEVLEATLSFTGEWSIVLGQDAPNIPFTGYKQQKAPTASGECRNIIKIVGRDGSVVIKELTDEQLSAYKTMVDHLPEADDL